MPDQTWALSRAALAEIVRHAEDAAPQEACGSVRRSGVVRRARNVQDDLHRADPVRYPRTGETAFEMSVDDLLDVDRSLGSDDPVKVVYHSHPGGVGAYFSAEDERRNVVDGAPLLPVDYLVVGVGADGRAREARLYRWDTGGGFTESCFFEIEKEALVTQPDVVVTVPRNFGAYADGTCEWKVNGSTVAEALAAASSGYADLRSRIFDPNGEGLRTYVRVFVDDEQADACTPLEDGAHVRVLPALGGGAPGGSRIATSILDAVGDTPLVELPALVAGTPARLLVKVESMNPTGSHKVRAAIAMVDAAEASGRLVRGSGQAIVVATGGNLGGALAVISSRRRYRLHAVVPDNYSPRKIALLRLLGAEVKLADTSLGNDAHAVRAAELAAELGDAFLLNQFEDPANPRAYAQTTAPEIVRDLGDERVDYLVGGIGSGAHLSGIGAALRAEMPDLAVVGVQPAECDLLRGHVAPHRLQGLAASAGLPPFIDRTLVASVESVTVQQAVAALKRTMLEEGISLGLSSAANIAACLEIARRLDAPATLLTFVYDSVSDYLDDLEDLDDLDDDPSLDCTDSRGPALVRRDPGALGTVTPTAFVKQLEAAGVRRGYVVRRDGDVVASHEAFRPLCDLIRTSDKFAAHEGVFVGTAPGIPTFFLACVHDTSRGLAQGGVRFRPYADVGSAVEDGLDLSHAMSRKNALAGLWWGGGKAVVPVPAGYGDALEVTGPLRKEIFAAFGRFVASLGGLYYTAEDMGTSTSDMDEVLANNRFTTCVSPDAGGSGDPSPFTSRGVLLGMRAAWKFVTGTSDLTDVRVGVQGVGHVGTGLVDLLAESGARVTVADVDQDAVAEVLRRHPSVEAVPAHDDSLFTRSLDILAPCATGGVVNARTIALLRAEVVCGAANNILAEPADADRLHDRGILYVPDYVTNRMGIVNCADEAFGHVPQEVERAVAAVYDDVWKILQAARAAAITPAAAADRLADEAMKLTHPLHPGRGHALLENLVSSEWGRPGPRPRRKSPSKSDSARRQLATAIAES